MNLKEYLFCDAARLESYYQQVNEKGVTTDIVPTWKASLSLTGPSAELTNQKVHRTPNRHTMIAELIEYLEQNALVERGRIFYSDRSFAQATFNARKVTLFSNEQLSITGRDHLALWISEKVAIPNSPKIKTMRFYLIQDCPERDPNQVRPISGFGALDFLISLEFTRRVLAAPLSMPELLNEKGSEEFGEPMRIFYQKKDYNLDSEFEREPIGFLAKLGAHIGDTRRIETLYRRRFSTYGYETSSSIEALVGLDFGYPIYIVEADAEE